MIEGNLPVFRGPGTPCSPGVESYFIKLVAPAGDRALWLRWTFLMSATDAPRSELWAVAFTRGRPPVAAKRSEPARAGCVSVAPWRITQGDSRWDGEHAIGAVTAGVNALAWDFTLAPTVGPLRLYPHAWMYRARAIPTKIITPIPDAIARGECTINQETVSLDGWRAMQGHNWGRAHTARYAWSHAAGFQGEPSAVFEGFAARPSLASQLLPWMSMAFLYVDGAWMRFDGLRAAARAQARVSVLRWDLELTNDHHTLRGSVMADTAEAAGLHYPNPQGAMTYCFNSKLADLTLELLSPGRAPRWFITRAAALEVATPFADRRVRMVG